MGEGELSLAEWMTGARSVDGSPVNYTLPFMTVCDDDDVNCTVNVMTMMMSSTQISCA